jgi:hypothetical protein
MTASTQKTAVECLQVSDALRLVVVQIDRLDRERHPGVCGSEAVAVLHCTGPIVAHALEDLGMPVASLRASRPPR